MKPPDEMPATVVFVLSTLYLPSDVTLWTLRTCPCGSPALGATPDPPPPHPPTTAASATMARVVKGRVSCTRRLPSLCEENGRKAVPIIAPGSGRRYTRRKVISRRNRSLGNDFHASFARFIRSPAAPP